jgi:hypothetical protein
MPEFINDCVIKPTLSLPEGEATLAPNYHVRMGFFLPVGGPYGRIFIDLSVALHIYPAPKWRSP